MSVRRIKSWIDVGNGAGARVSLPYLFVGCKIAISLAVIGAIVGEFISGRPALGIWFSPPTTISIPIGVARVTNTSIV